MIQRIQTIYFILIAGLMLAMLFLPLMYFSGPESLVFKPNGLFQVASNTVLVSTWILVALIALVPLNTLITMFLYRNRPLQIRLAIVNICLVVLVYLGCAFYYLSFTKGNYGHYEFAPSVALVFPFVVFILNILAIQAIRKDEKLVKSLDRIR